MPLTPSQQRLLDRATSLTVKTAASAMLFKYVDDEGKEFYLPERKMGTMKSPFTGKTFTAKPEKSTLNDVGKDLKEEGAKVKSALFKYVDDDGKPFYLPSRVTTTLRSPYTGKSFTPKAEKDSLSEVGKDLKGGGEEKKAAVLDVDGSIPVNVAATPPKVASSHHIGSSPDQWEEASEILTKGKNHPALQVVLDQWEAVLRGVEDAKKRSERMQKIGVGHTEDPTFLVVEVVPELEQLAKIAARVAQQMRAKFE